MKENKYDEPDFFASYSNFARSVEGLAAAGERHVLKRMLPDLRGRRVLDIGCGFGWHCGYAADNGAEYVLGTDISARMIEGARQRNNRPCVEYRVAAMEDLVFDPGSFDVVISSLAFHYTPRLERMCTDIFRWLTPGGSFVFSVEHPVFTAEGSQQWIEKSTGGKVWPVDNYFSEKRRETCFLGSRVVKYHRTLTTYIQNLLRAGFMLTDIEEPQPDNRLLDSVEGMRDELKRPMMLIVAAAKPGEGQC